MYHILYILICPILALKEFGNVLKNSINRDLGGLKKNDPKVFDTNPVILVKDWKIHKVFYMENQTLKYLCRC